MDHFSRVQYLFILLYGLYSYSHAQTGPAGIGGTSTNMLWLKADVGVTNATNNASVSAWNDQSGNGNNVSQATGNSQPIYQTGIINGFPAILFDNNNGTNDKLQGADSPTLDNTSGYTFFTVSRQLNLDGASARVIVSKRNSVDVDESFMLFYYTGNKFFVDVQTTNNRFNSASAFANNTNYIIDMVYDGTLASGSRSKLYIGESLDVSATETSTLVPDNNSPFVVGSTDATDPRPFGGYIAEIIGYRVALNKASRIIINNYLSSKYNIALSARDKYAGDTPANGDYDYEVAGIGSDTIQPSGTVGTNTVFASSVAAGLGITSVSGLDVGDYILAGHASKTNAQIFTDVGGMTGTSNARWQRIWYVDVTNTGTNNTVNIEFDMSDGGVGNVTLGPASNYVLLYRAGQSGNWTELTTASAISGDKVQFNAYALTLDGYYTIGTRNWPVSPLPVELVYFTGERESNAVNLLWKTQTEHNNHYFTLEHSETGETFQTLTTVNSKAPGGNSLQPLEYNYRDANPYTGINYYRLSQTDLGGSKKTYNVISVMYDQGRDIAFTVYPNPGKGQFNVDFSGIENNHEILVEMHDMQGRLVYSRNVLTNDLQSDSFQILPSEPVPTGEYIITFTTEDIQYPVRVIVE
ncbi:MAG: T9SS type A sorting domain-containing protein [Bacteroidetes bacterium]|nr:T9SS type A sorting domain-containing protein [Bacteroidota bacterium]